MYPFKSRLVWNIKGRHAHIIAATEQKLPKFPATLRKRIERRITRLKQAATLRLTLFVLLYLGTLAAVVSWISGFVGEGEEVASGIATVTQWTGSASAAILLLILVVGRRMAQLEADIIMLVALRNG